MCCQFIALQWRVHNANRSLACPAPPRPPALQGEGEGEAGGSPPAVAIHIEEPEEGGPEGAGGDENSPPPAAP